MSYMLPGYAVTKFHELVGQPAPTNPLKSFDENSGRTDLRIGLIKEELKEMLDEVVADDPVAFLKEAVDLVYIVVGMCVEMGLPFDDAFQAVHRSNMAKAGPCSACYEVGIIRTDQPEGGRRSKVCESCGGKGRVVKLRDDGKVLKPEGWQAPNIGAVVNRRASHGV